METREAQINEGEGGRRSWTWDASFGEGDEKKGKQ